VPSLPESVEAPIRYGEVVGSVDVVVENRVIARIPVVATHEVASKGFGNALRRILENWAIVG